MDETAQAEGKVGVGSVRRWLSQFGGMGPFSLLWLGHVVTLLGTSAIEFAFVIRAWTAGGQATQVVMLWLAAMLPKLLLSPIAGALVDRLNRRTALQLSELGGLVAIGGLTAVYYAGDLEMWHIYVAVALAGCAEAFQYPALSAAIPQLVGKDQLQRANGLLATAQSTADIGGPALGGLLVAVSGLGFILWIDLASFVFALAIIQFVRIPDISERARESQPRQRLLAESIEGLRYLFARPGLRGLVAIFFVVNLAVVFGFAVLQPMILARTGNDAAALASVNTAIGVGGIVGGIILTAWGGPKDRVRGMMWGIVGLAASAQIAVAMGRTVPVWIAGILIGAALLPIVNGALQSVIQTKVAGELQGRVFGAVQFVTEIAAPLAMCAAGPLADHVFERHAASGGGISGPLGPLLGHGPGSGMAAMLLIAGCAGAAAALCGLASRTVRRLDVLIPDIETDEGDA